MSVFDRAATAFIVLMILLAALMAYADAQDATLTPGSVSGLPCHEPLRLYDTDKPAYYAQARRVFAAYGVPYADRRSYELDHRVPRCLGGADTDANLWPEPLVEARHKDALEHLACHIVCAATGQVEMYRAIFLDDWRANYRSVFGSEP